MLHVGALHQAAEVEAQPGRRAEVGGRLRGEVGVDERRQVGLVGEQRRAQGGRAPPQRGAPLPLPLPLLLLRQAVAGRGGAAACLETVRLVGSRGSTTDAVPLLPAAAAAAAAVPSEPAGGDREPITSGPKESHSILSKQEVRLTKYIVRGSISWPY